MEHVVKPSRYFYFIPVGIVILGFIFAGVFAIMLMFGEDISTSNVSEPLVFEVNEGDTRVLSLNLIQLETYYIVENFGHLILNINGTNMQLYFNPDQVKIKLLDDNTEFIVNSYVIVLEFEFKVTGTVTITPSFTNNQVPEMTFGIFDSSIWWISALFIGMTSSILGGFGIALIVAIVIKVKRNNSKNMVLREAQKIMDQSYKNPYDY